MSSVASFKQQCPSCGGQITIKNPDLIGKKVDCPKCKTRFTVADPDDGVADETAGDAVRTKAKAKKTRSKPDHEADAAPKKGIKKQYVLAGVAVAVVALVGVVILITTGGGDKTKSPRTGTGAGTGTRPGVQPAPPVETAESRLAALVDKAVADSAGKPEADALIATLSGDNAEERNLGVQKLKERAVAGIGRGFELLELLSRSEKAELKELAQKTMKEVEEQLAKREAGLRDDPTNMLPVTTQVVLSIPVKEFADSPFGTAVLRTRGAFRSDDFETRLGIPLHNIERVVLSGNRDHAQSLAVVRTFESMDWDSVRRALKLTEAPARTIKGKPYFLGHVDFLTEFASHLVPIAPLRDKAAVHKKDDRTLVYGDVKSIEEFLQNPPTFQMDPVVAPKTGFRGFQPPPPDAGAEQKPEEKPAEEPKPAAAPQSPPGYTGIPGRPDLKTFLTLKPSLRRLIERADFKKAEPALVLFAADTAKDSPATLVPYLNRLKPPQASQVLMVALALSQVDQLTLTVAMMCRSKDAAPPVEAELKKILEEASKGELKEALGFEFLGPWNEPVGEPIARGTPAPSVPGGPSGYGGEYMRRMGVGRGVPGPIGVGTAGGKGTGSPDDENTGSPDGTVEGPTGPPGYPRGQQYPTMPIDPEAPPPAPREGSSIDFFRQDEFITVLVTVIDDIKSFTEGPVAIQVIRKRGEMDMRSGRFGPEQLVDAVRAATKEGFWRGSAARPPSAERRFRPWPPDQRVSWMRELLPFLGDDRYGDLYRGIDPALSWRDPKNVRSGSVIVPHFLHPQGGRYYTKVRGVDWEMAVTHFVGMAGVGPDAPYYDKNDPRAGIFGYDRQTKKEDVKDGLSNTIMMIQTDPGLVGPWIAGGGSTTRGTSDAGNDVGEIGGFSSPVHQGKQGVYVYMADGSVRFLAKGISPEVFKALCTMAGGDNAAIGELDRVAPLVNPPKSKPADAKAQTKPEKPVEATKPEAKPADKPKDKP